MALAILDTNNNIDEAFNELEKENKDDEDILLINANLLYDKEKYDEALEIYEKVKSLNDKNEDALIGIANCLYKKGNKDDALKLYDEILENNTKNQNDYLIKAQHHVKIIKMMKLINYLKQP